MRALVAAVQQQVESRQEWHELAVQLRVNRMAEVLPLHRDAMLREQIGVQIALRGVATQVAVGSEMATDGDETLRLSAVDAKLRRADDMRRDPKPCRHQPGDGDVEIRNPPPRTRQHLF